MSLAKSALKITAALTAVGAAGVMLGALNATEAQNLKTYTLPDSKFLDIDGARVHYTDQGPREAQVIFLLHGTNESLRAWDAVVPELTDRYRVIRMDLLNSGLSSGDPKGRYFVEDDCHRISVLMDNLGVGRFTFGGSSNGATIAFYYAVFNPDRVAALALTSVPGVRDTNKYFKLHVGLNAFDRWLHRYYQPASRIEADIRALAANPDFLTPETVRQFHDFLNQKGRHAAWANRLEHLKPAQKPARAQSMLAKVSAPTLVLWGRNNPAYGPGCADDLEKIMINAPVVKKIIYDTVGHKTEREAPEQFAADLKAFLGEVLKG
jgi:pimeloyl-ACP methyl ester carboxylesterase